MSRFHLPLTTAVSAALLACSGCGSADEWQTSSNARVCLDDSGTRIDDAYCRNPEDTRRHWYYIARGGYIPRTGYPASRGSYVPIGSESYGSAPESAPEGAVTRGGFGASGESHGGGDGE